MADIVINDDEFSVVFIDPLGTIECHMEAAVDDRRGKLFYVNTDNGAVLADASASGTLGTIMGIAGTKEKMSIAGESVTLLRRAVINPGSGTVFDAMDVGDPVYASDNAGMLSDTAGTVSTQVGRIIKDERADGSLRNLIALDTTRL